MVCRGRISPSCWPAVVRWDCGLFHPMVHPGRCAWAKTQISSPRRRRWWVWSVARGCTLPCRCNPFHNSAGFCCAWFLRAVLTPRLYPVVQALYLLLCICWLTGGCLFASAGVLGSLRHVDITVTKSIWHTLPHSSPSCIRTFSQITLDGLVRVNNPTRFDTLEY